MISNSRSQSQQCQSSFTSVSFRRNRLTYHFLSLSDWWILSSESIIQTKERSCCSQKVTGIFWILHMHICEWSCFDGLRQTQSTFVLIMVFPGAENRLSIVLCESFAWPLRLMLPHQQHKKANVKNVIFVSLNKQKLGCNHLFRHWAEIKSNLGRFFLFRMSYLNDLAEGQCVWWWSHRVNNCSTIHTNRSDCSTCWSYRNHAVFSTLTINNF